MEIGVKKHKAELLTKKEFYNGILRAALAIILQNISFHAVDYYSSLFGMAAFVCIVVWLLWDSTKS